MEPSDVFKIVTSKQLKETKYVSDMLFDWFWLIANGVRILSMLAMFKTCMSTQTQRAVCVIISASDRHGGHGAAGLPVCLAMAMHAGLCAWPW
jgi:hypothetical protein